MYYILATEFEEKVITDYGSAVNSYNREDESATLYSVDEQGEFDVLFSK